MNAKQKLVSDTTSRLPHCKPRPVLSIVKGLGLDNVEIPGTKKSAKAKGTKLSLVPRNNADGLIPESGRNNALMSLAGAMRRKGMSEAAIDAALQTENKVRCDPPLDEAEVSTIANSVMRYEASDEEQIKRSLNDMGNAERMGRGLVGEVLYVTGFGWHVWVGMLWCRDAVGKITELAKQVARDIYLEGIKVENTDLQQAIAKHAKSSHQAPKLKAMIELAQSLPELVAIPDQLDSHDMLLGVANGVIDLRTGKLQAAQREQLLTRHSGAMFDAKAICPKFLAFIHQVTAGDKALAGYLQRVVGYALTGDASEQCIFFLHGSGANGKTTFLNVVKDLLGKDLALQTPSETLMTKRSSQTNDLARLHTVRVVIANEVEDGSLLAEALVKQMTGGDVISARFHYKEFFDFVPKFKLFIAGNHKPVIRGRDNGIWRRIRLVPFEVSIPKAQQDKHLPAKLRAELPGILNWALTGCLVWQKSGLNEPKVVTDAATSYKEEMDVIGQWLKERCKVGPLLETKASAAYYAYKLWAEGNGYKPMASGPFGQEFVTRFVRAKRNDGNYFVGVQCM